MMKEWNEGEDVCVGPGKGEEDKRSNKREKKDEKRDIHM